MGIIVAFALVGLLLGGGRGLLLGALIGYAVTVLLRDAARRAVSREEPQLLDATFAVMGALCKADNVVTRNEIRAAEQLFDRLHLSAAQREAAKAAFRRGKEPSFDLDAEVARARHACRGRAPLLMIFLHVQYTAVAADGRVHPAEHAMLVRIARGLGLSPADIARIEAMLRAGASGGAGAYGAGRAADVPGRLEAAYATLGVGANASDAELTKAYRRLMSQNHPDKLAGKGLPESMREIAEERTREISAAYRLIRETRERRAGAP